MQLLLQFCTNCFETLQMFSAWNEDVHVVLVSSLDIYFSLSFQFSVTNWSFSSDSAVAGLQSDPVSALVHFGTFEKRYRYHIANWNCTKTDGFQNWLKVLQGANIMEAATVVQCLGQYKLIARFTSSPAISCYSLLWFFIAYYFGQLQNLKEEFSKGVIYFVRKL